MKIMVRHMIERNDYLNKLKRNMWNGEVKVITGIRRCGKSVLLFDLFYSYLAAQGVSNDNILSFELDQRRNARFRNPVTLCEEVEHIVLSDPNEKYYLFIDEVQYCIPVEENGVEISIYDMLNELKAYDNLDVYVIGSYSKMLSKDIMTEFRGRATQIHVYPLSFKEYYDYIGGDRRSAFEQYMLYGGMPRILFIEDERDRKEYLSSLFSEVYVKDIVERNGIERNDVLNVILDYMASQISSLTNATKVANALTSIRHEKVQQALVATYMEHIMDTFLVNKVYRYDVKGKSYFKYPNKYYFTDIGLRNARLNFRQFDPGHIMENIIYNELIRRGYSVDIGVVKERSNRESIQREIDFVVNDGDRRIYIQSAYMMMEEGKVQSELQSLKLTGDFFRKVILRMDIPHSFYDENGFFHCNLLDYLLGETDIF